MSNKQQSVASSLVELGVDIQLLNECDGLDAEFSMIKKIYFKQSLLHHPDRGGDAALFRVANEAFVFLRELKEGGLLTSFGQAAAAANTAYDRKRPEDRKGGGGGNRGGESYYNTQSYEFFEAAAEEPVPIYRVEPARSGRSKCKATSKVYKKCDHSSIIEKGEVRVASLDRESGSYTFWFHIRCWRVPMKVWIAMPDGMDYMRDLANAAKIKKSSKKKRGEKATSDDAAMEEVEKEEDAEEESASSSSAGRAKLQGKELLDAYMDALHSLNEVILCGFNELDEDQKLEFVNHVINKDNWARPTKLKEESVVAYDSSNSSSSANNNSNSASGGGVGRGGNVKSEHTNGTFPPAAAATAGSVKSESQEMLFVPASQISSNGGAVSTSRKFTWPIPGVDAPADTLSGMTLVLTGVFPQVGGGAGLNLGKERLKGLIEVFGAKVTSAVSGKTSILVVGNEPGASKVMTAKSQPRCKLMKVEDLRTGILQGNLKDYDPGIGQIQHFSSGYRGNGLFNTIKDADRDDLLSKTAYVPPSDETALVVGSAASSGKKKRKRETKAEKLEREKREEAERERQDDDDDDDMEIPNPKPPPLPKARAAKKPRKNGKAQW